jgi:hypothetical protein
MGAAPYALVFLVSCLSFIYPNAVGWVLAAIPCAAYTVMIVLVPLTGVAHVPLDEWIIFFLIGLAPCLVLWWARPAALRRGRAR